MPRSKKILEEEIYKLREQGMTYQEIAKYFEEKGIKISWETIRQRCKKIFEKKGKKVPKANRKKEITDEEIYKLREQGMAYENILKYFEEKGIKISYGSIRERCKRIYSEKGESEPKAIRKKEITNEEIYKLREQGMTYKEILSYFEEKNIKTSYGLIRERCKAIYKEKGRTEPRIKKKGAKKKKDISDEEIYKLREQGMLYKDIADYFKEKGITVTLQTIRYRCKKIYRELGKEEPNLKRRKKVTDELGEKNGKKTIINSQNNEETLEELDQILNEKIKQKIEMEKILKILVDYINTNKRGIEK